MIDDRSICVYVAHIAPDLQKIGVSRNLAARSLTLRHGAKEFLGVIPERVSFGLIGLVQNSVDAHRIESSAIDLLPNRREWQRCSLDVAIDAVRRASRTLGIELVELIEPPASCVMSTPSLSVRLPEPQREFLRQEAERLGIGVSELLRLVIHAYIITEQRLRKGRES